MFPMSAKLGVILAIDGPFGEHLKLKNISLLRLKNNYPLLILVYKGSILEPKTLALIKIPGLLKFYKWKVYFQKYLHSTYRSYIFTDSMRWSISNGHNMISVMGLGRGALSVWDSTLVFKSLKGNSTTSLWNLFHVHRFFPMFNWNISFCDLIYSLILPLDE